MLVVPIKFLNLEIFQTKYYVSESIEQRGKQKPNIEQKKIIDRKNYHKKTKKMEKQKEDRLLRSS